jgi:hypothetical protein
MPQVLTIGNFIYSHRSNLAIAQVGKLAIASAILDAERSSALHVNRDNIFSIVNLLAVADTWFNTFFQLIGLNAQEEGLPSHLSRVRVGTFKYDLVIAQILYNLIQKYYGSKQDLAAIIVSNLCVLHTYGHVGALPWQRALQRRSAETLSRLHWRKERTCSGLSQKERLSQTARLSRIAMLS